MASNVYTLSTPSQEDVEGCAPPKQRSKLEKGRYETGTCKDKKCNVAGLIFLILRRLKKGMSHDDSRLQTRFRESRKQKA